MPSKNETIFHVKLGNIELSDAAKARIENRLQEAVLSELANYPNPDDDTKPLRPKKKHPWGYITVPLVEKLGKYIRFLGVKEFDVSPVVANERNL